MSFFVRTVLIVLVLASFGCLRKGPSENELLAMAKGADSTLDEAYNKRDLEAFMKHYAKSPDLVVIDGGRFLNGYDAWRKEIQSQFDQIGTSAVKFYLSDKHNVVKGDHVYGYGYYKVILPVKDASDTIINGLYTSVKAFRDGQLLTVMETYSHTNTPPAKSISLIPGYTDVPGRGIDSVVGDISKPGSDFKIHYDIGHMSGVAADGVQNALWKKTLTFGDTRIAAAYGKDKKLTVSFAQASAAPANFFATIGSEEELSDMLLMMATYNRK